MLTSEARSTGSAYRCPRGCSPPRPPAPTGAVTGLTRAPRRRRTPLQAVVATANARLPL